MGAELWIPPRAKDSFKKAPPPKLGEKFGAWSGPNVQYLTMPGGGVLQFDLSRLTLADFRSMRDHYQINASLSVLSFMMHRLDWHVECTDTKIATFIEDGLRKVWTRLIRGLSQAYWAGYSPMVIQWENDLGNQKVVATKFKDLLPEECRVNWDYVEGYAPDGFMKPKMPVFNGILQSPYGFSGVGSIPEGGTREGIIRSGRAEIPVENSLWYPLLMENGDYYGRKILRPAFPSWFFSILIHLFTNRYLERFGEPTPVGRADYEGDVMVGGEVVSGRTAMENILTALRNRSVVVLPSNRDPETKEYDYQIEYLESQMRGADFERYLGRLDEEMSVGIFTPMLLFRTADVGSYNLGVAHMQLFMWMLNALAGDLKEYIDKYVIDRLKVFNYGEKAPQAFWAPHQMGKENTETLRAIVTELIRGSKAKADLTELSDAIGIKIEEDKPQAPLVAVGPDGKIPTPPTPIIAPGGGEPGGAKPGADKRGIRGKPKSAGPKGVGQPRATGKQVAARLREQAVKAYRDGDKNFLPILSHRKQFEDALQQEGCSAHDAHSIAASMYYRLEEWLTEVVGVYDTADELVAGFERVLEEELSSLADTV